MGTQDKEVDEIDHQLTEDDGKLVPAHQHTADMRGRYLSYIHRTDGGCQSHTYTTDDTVDIEHDKQRERGLALLEKDKLRIHAS